MLDQKLSLEAFLLCILIDGPLLLVKQDLHVGVKQQLNFQKRCPVNSQESFQEARNMDFQEGKMILFLIIIHTTSSDLEYIQFIVHIFETLLGCEVKACRSMPLM